MDLSIRMASWRRAKGLSQSQVAKPLGIGTPSVSMWETGACRPSVDNLHKFVALALGETMARFYDDAALAAELAALPESKPS